MVTLLVATTIDPASIGSASALLAMPSWQPCPELQVCRVPHLREEEVPPAGGNPGWAAPPNPRSGPWLRLLKDIAESHKLTPEFEAVPREYWKRQDAAQAIAQLPWEGLGLNGGAALGDWNRKHGVLVGHLLSEYSLLMEDPGQSKGQANAKTVGGTWSFKSWQKNAILEYLSEVGIKVGKPGDFC